MQYIKKTRDFIRIPYLGGFFYSQTSNFPNKTLKSIPKFIHKDSKTLELLQNSEYVKQNLYKMTENPINFSRILERFVEDTASVKTRPTNQHFETLYFRNIIKLISGFIQTHKSQLPNINLSLILEIFLSYANIYHRFGGFLKSSKTILFTNKIWKILYEKKSEISYHQALIILNIMGLLGYRILEIFLSYANIYHRFIIRKKNQRYHIIRL